MWINVPSTTSRCAQAEPASISDWNWLWEAFAQSAGSNGKPSPASTWRRLWKRAAWFKLLCGRICEPSTAALGVESWIASLLATRANRSASPANAVDQTILDICGPMSVASLARLNRQSCFSKTCPATSASDSRRSPQTLKAWVTRLRQGSSQRRKLAQATSGSGCSSSPWLTPNSVDWKGANPQWEKSAARHAARGVSKQMNLREQVVLWQTIKASDGEKGGPNQRDGKGNPYLPMQAALWPTPNVPNGGRTVPQEQMTAGVTPSGRKVQKPLARTAELWPTPRTITGGAESAERKKELGRMESGGGDLQAAVRNWPTPRAEERCQYNSQDDHVALSRAVTSWPTPSTRDYRTPNSLESQQRRNSDSKRGQQLSNFVSHNSSLLAPTTSTDGEKCLRSTMHLPRLNPLFVCWLMGWPRIAPGGFGFTETEWFRFKRPMRFALCGLLCGLTNESPRQ